VSDRAPLVSIVVVTFNAPDYVRLCLQSILTRTRLPHELIVVDNASEGPTRRLLAETTGIRLLQNEENRLWCAASNQGLQAADPRSRLLLLMNSDVEVLRDDWLEVLLTLLASRPDVGLVGPRHNRVSYGPIYGYPDGHCLLLRREVLRDAGGRLDEERWPWFGAPAELTVAAYAHGWRYRVVHPDDRVIHHYGGKSQDSGFRERLNDLPRGRRSFRDIMLRHGVAERTPFWERKFLPRWLRRVQERRRFYYAPPVGPAGVPPEFAD